jgi:hypothetical protein
LEQISKLGKISKLEIFLKIGTNFEKWIFLKNETNYELEQISKLEKI